MKFEEFLMQREDEHQKRLDLEAEVAELEEVLDQEQNVNRILQCALHGPSVCRPCLSSFLPIQVQVLLAEIAMVEEEIAYLERKVEELKLCLYQDKRLTEEWREEQKQDKWRHRQHTSFLCGFGGHKVIDMEQFSPIPCTELTSQTLTQETKPALGSVAEIRSMSSTRMSDEEAERLRSCMKNQDRSCSEEEINAESPNKISQELVRCLIGIYHKLNKTLTRSDYVPKLSLSCMSSKGFMSKASSNCKNSMYFSDDTVLILDPYGTLPDIDGTVRDIGPYKNFVHLTRSSMDMDRVSQCFAAIRRLRVLMHKLCNLDLSLLTYKQKLAFWINIYNACIMHAFLLHGLPLTPDKLLSLMDKAVLDVGGIVLNALAIEHFILRHPSDPQHDFMDEKEALLRHVYGLGYPEPNVTFALCRGSWSSPALRVYTAENIVNELERAKIEYLEASVGITSKKKIMVPRLLHWYMKDFADDIESLIEWIYSQLPRTGTLKKTMTHFLHGETKLPTSKMVEVQPYESEFRYLLPL